MDSPSNGLGKLFPKRRRNKASSVAETASSNDDVVPQRGTSVASLSTTSSNANSINDSLQGDEIADPTSYASDSES